MLNTWQVMTQEYEQVRKLLDVLPCRNTTTGEQTQRRSYVIDAAVAEALATCARGLSTSPTKLLCAALLLVESRLTGADSAVGAMCAAGCVTQRPIAVPFEGGLEPWLASVTRGSDARVASAPPATWIVHDDEVAALSDRSSPLRWRLDLGDNPALIAHYRGPFNTDSVDLLAACALRVLAAFGSEAQGRLERIDLLYPDARRRLLIEWNATAIPRRAADSVNDLFVAEAKQHAERIAVVDGNSSITYAQLERRANVLAFRLREVGVLPAMIVGVMLARSVDAVVAMLAVLKVGAAYLPLDGTFPAERIAFMLDDANARIVVVDSQSPLSLPERSVTVTVPSGGDDVDPINADVDGKALAYVMYTSGSTGTPKGVEILHRSIIRLVRDVDYISLDDGTRMLHAAPLGFDASTLEIWGALLNGGCVVVHGETVPTGAGLAATIKRHQVSTAFLTTALFNAIVDVEPRDLAGLRELFTGGEKVSVSHVRRALDALPDTDVFHPYGPTECTTFTTTYRIPRDLAADAHTIPIGRPIADTTLYVLNQRMGLVPIGVIGELYIGGAGVARGYLGRPELTAERFVPNPFEDSAERLYRTGDLVRYLPDGAVEFVGRIDGQVKIRGYRIETGEIEAVLARHPGVCAQAPEVRADRPCHWR